MMEPMREVLRAVCSDRCNAPYCTGCICNKNGGCDSPEYEALAALAISLMDERDRYRAALEEIARGRGAFSIDPLTHAGNCIDEMKSTARAALEPVQ